MRRLSWLIPMLALPLIGAGGSAPQESAEASLTTLTAQVLRGLIKHNPLFLNQFGIPSYTVTATKRTADGDTLVTVQFTSGGKAVREDLLYRILEAELFLTEEKSSLGIGGVARIAWTWGLRTEGLRSMGDVEAFYFALSKKTGDWVPVTDEWAKNAFRDVKSHWADDAKERHAIVKAPRR